MEGVCKQLRNLNVIRNFSLEHSVTITCDPSFSASNEIHVCLVSASFHFAIFFSLADKSLIYGLWFAFPVAVKDAVMELYCVLYCTWAPVL